MYATGQSDAVDGVDWTVDTGFSSLTDSLDFVASVSLLVLLVLLAVSPIKVARVRG